MVGVNQFINSHRQGMIDFVDKISVSFLLRLPWHAMGLSVVV